MLGSCSLPAGSASRDVTRTRSSTCCCTLTRVGSTWAWTDSDSGAVEWGSLGVVPGGGDSSLESVVVVVATVSAIGLDASVPA